MGLCEVVICSRCIICSRFRSVWRHSRSTSIDTTLHTTAPQICGFRQNQRCVCSSLKAEYVGLFAAVFKYYIQTGPLPSGSAVHASCTWQQQQFSKIEKNYLLFYVGARVGETKYKTTPSWLQPHKHQIIWTSIMCFSKYILSSNLPPLQRAKTIISIYRINTWPFPKALTKATKHRKLCKTCWNSLVQTTFLWWGNSEDLLNCLMLNCERSKPLI